MIQIVKPYLPSKSKYLKYLDSIYQKNWLTNKGPLLQELEWRLAEYLGVEHLMLVSNGTLALQLAYQALGVKSGEVITTPFTFAATPGSMLWQGLSPRFVDIDKSSWNINTQEVASRITTNTQAIVPVHVFGNPCEVEALQRLAEKHSLKLIYDAAHAFGSTYNTESLLKYGDAATVSLHATKIFHCIEGGAVVFKHKADIEHARRLINFGFDKDNIPIDVGFNAKMSEFHAAMGLSMLDDIDELVERRQAIVARYQELLSNVVTFQVWNKHGHNNGAYAPVLFESESQLLNIVRVLERENIQVRRYFYPSLNQCSAYKDDIPLAISEDISRRIMCLPLPYDLEFDQQKLIARLIIENL